MKAHFHEHHSRSLVKTITYRILIVLSNGAVVYIVTGDSKFTYEIMGYSTLISTAIYYFHERIWNSIHWGKHHAKEKHG
jgi:uncharacterized membrane protein